MFRSSDAQRFKPGIAERQAEQWVEEAELAYDSARREGKMHGVAYRIAIEMANLQVRTRAQDSEVLRGMGYKDSDAEAIANVLAEDDAV